MRVFVKYSQDGEVLSVSRVELMPPHVEHPYQGSLEKDEAVLEIPLGTAQAKLDPIELHDGYKVDVKKKKLIKK